MCPALTPGIPTSAEHRSQASGPAGPRHLPQPCVLTALDRADTV